VHYAQRPKPQDEGVLSPNQANDELFYIESERSVRADNTFSPKGKRCEVPISELLAPRGIITLTPDTSIRAAAAKLIGVLTLHDIARQQNTASEQKGR